MIMQEDMLSTAVESSALNPMMGTMLIDAWAIVIRNHCVKAALSVSSAMPLFGLIYIVTPAHQTPYCHPCANPIKTHNTMTPALRLWARQHALINSSSSSTARN